MSTMSTESRRAKACARLVSLRGRAESSPRYLPAESAHEYDGILDDLDALGFDIAEFRILPHELQRFAAYVVVASTAPTGQRTKSGYYVNRGLLSERIDSALTSVGGPALKKK